MKRINLLVVVTLLLTTVVGCSKVPAGHVGVKVYLLGGDKGVDTEELGVGRYWIGINEELYLFPTFTQTDTWVRPAEKSGNADESISFQTVEGMSVNADVGISYRILPDKVSVVFQKYRKGVREISDTYLRNMVRDAFVTAASNKSVEQVYGSGKVAFLTEVEGIVRTQTKPIGIEIERIYLVGDLRLPNTVLQALNAKIEATQRAQQRENEIKEAEAEAKKKIAEAEGKAKSILVEAESQAKANRLLSESISVTLVEYEKARKWDGKMPQVTGGGVPLLSLGK